MKITKSQLKQIIKEELEHVLSEGVFDDIYKSTIGDAAQRKVKKWWLEKLKHPKAKDVDSPRHQANVKAGIFGQGEHHRPREAWRDAEDRVDAARTGAPVIEADFTIRGGRISLNDMRGAFLDVTGEDWLPNWLSSEPAGGNTDVDGDGDTDVDDVVDVAKAAAGDTEEGLVSESMKITKSQLKQLIKEELEKTLKEGGYREGTIPFSHLLQVNRILEKHGYALRQPLDGPLELITL